MGPRSREKTPIKTSMCRFKSYICAVFVTEISNTMLMIGTAERIGPKSNDGTKASRYIARTCRSVATKYPNDCFWCGA